MATNHVAATITPKMVQYVNEPLLLKILNLLLKSAENKFCPDRLVCYKKQDGGYLLFLLDGEVQNAST